MFELISLYKDIDRNICTTGFKNACYGINESALDSIMSYSVEHMDFSKPLNSSIENLMTIEDTDDLVLFYENIVSSFNLNNRPITVGLMDTDAISKIRPQYLNLYVRELNKTFKKWAAGSIKADTVDMERVKTICMKLADKTKKQVVCTTLPSAEALMLQTRNPDMFTADADFISNITVPFVRNFNIVKGQLINEAQDILRATNMVKDQLQSLTEAGSKLKLDPETKRLFDFYVFNTVKFSYDMMTYIVSMTIQRIGAYVYNMNTFCKLYNTIHNFYPEGSRILHENAIDSGLDDLDDTTLMNAMIYNDTTFLYPMIHQCLDRNSFEADHLTRYVNTDDIIDNINGYDCDGEYDKNCYEQTLAVLKIVNEKMRGMYEASKDPNMTVDDIINRSGANDAFTDKFGPLVAAIPDTSAYTRDLNSDNGSPQAALKMIKTELANYDTNISKIAAACQAIYKNISSMQKSYKYNVNGQFGSSEQADELLQFADEFEQQIKDISINLIKAFIQRLKGLKGAMESIDVFQEKVCLPIAVYDRDDEYLIEAYNSIIEEKTILERGAFESLLMDYNSYRSKVERGVELVYEANTNEKKNDNDTDKKNASNDKSSDKSDDSTDNPQVNISSNTDQQNETDTNNSDKNTGDQNNSNTTDNSNNDNNQQGKTDAKPSDTNNSNNQNNSQSNAQNNTNNTTDNNSQNNQNKKGIIREALDKFMKFVKDLINKFKGKVKKLGPKANYVKNNKDKILNAINEKTSLKLQPYYPAFDYKRFVADMKTFENNIKSKAIESAKKSQGEFRSDIFGFISTKQIGNFTLENDFGKFIMAYYSSGNNIDDFEKGRVVTGDALKNDMTNEIEYISNYETICSEVANTCNRILRYIDAEFANKLGIEPSNTNNNTQNNSNTNNNATDNNNNTQNNSQNTNESVILNESVLFEDGEQTNSNDNNNSEESIISKVTGDVRVFGTTILTVLEKRFMNDTKIMYTILNGGEQSNNQNNNNDNNNANNSNNSSNNDNNNNDNNNDNNSNNDQSNNQTNDNSNSNNQNNNN